MNRYAERHRVMTLALALVISFVSMKNLSGQSIWDSTIRGETTEAEALVKDDITATEASVPAVAPTESKAYIGLITADRVYVRSGPAGIYYPVCYLQKDQQVIVREVLKGKNDWAKIEPTAQCFSYIAKEFVELKELERPIAARVEATEGMEDTPAAPAVRTGMMGTDLAALVGKEAIMGEVTGNAVRVRAGSMRIAPEMATQVQLKLNKGDKVRVIGVRDNYYKIISPSNAYFWVSLDFIKKLEGATPEQFEQVRQLARRDVAMMIEPEKFQSQYDDFLTLSKEYELEQNKPLLARDYESIMQKIDTILSETRSTSIQRSAENLKRNVERVMTAQMTLKRSRERDHMLMMKMQQIDNELQTMVGSEMALTNKDENVSVKGILAHSAVFTQPNKNRRYLVINNMEKIECYAVTNSDMIDLEDWVNRQVFLRGNIKYDAFSKSRILFVDLIEEVKPMAVTPVIPTIVEEVEPQG